MASGLRLRPADPGDVPALADLYESAVRELGPARYGPRQVEAGAAFAREPGFAPFILDATTLVAHRASAPVGFCGLTGRGRVASLYVHPAHGRAGVGETLLRAVLELATGRGMSRLHAEASALSRGVFEKAGFRVAEVERVKRRGVHITRHRMVLEPGGRGPEEPDPP